MENDSNVLWQYLVRSFHEYKKALGDFFSEKVDRTAFVRSAIGTNERIVAIEIAHYLNEEEHKKLFDVWVGGASTANSFVHIFRKFILSLPRDWVMERIEATTEPYLISGEMDEYRRFLELYLLLDTSLTLKLAERSAANADLEIREAGYDFLQILKDESSITDMRERLIDNRTLDREHFKLK